MGCGVLGRPPPRRGAEKRREGQSFDQTGEVLAFRGRAGRFRPHLQMNVQRGARVALALALLVGFGLKQGADSAVFTALLVGLAVLMIGLKRDTARH